MKFEQHGIYAVEVKGKVMIVDAQGPFNDELVKSYTQAVKSAVMHLSGEAWGQIIILRGLSLFTPDAEQLLYDVTVWRKEHNLSASAVLMLNTEAKELVRSQISRIYEKASIEYGFYEDIESAMTWLQAKF